jgi:hypothetical protein
MTNMWQMVGSASAAAERMRSNIKTISLSVKDYGVTRSAGQNGEISRADLDSYDPNSPLLARGYYCVYWQVKASSILRSNMADLSGAGGQMADRFRISQEANITMKAGIDKAVESKLSVIELGPNTITKLQALACSLAGTAPTSESSHVVTCDTRNFLPSGIQGRLYGRSNGHHCNKNFEMSTMKDGKTKCDDTSDKGRSSGASTEMVMFRLVRTTGLVRRGFG